MSVTDRSSQHPSLVRGLLFPVYRQLKKRHSEIKCILFLPTPKVGLMRDQPSGVCLREKSWDGVMPGGAAASRRSCLFGLSRLAGGRRNVTHKFKENALKMLCFLKCFVKQGGQNEKRNSTSCPKYFSDYLPMACPQTCYHEANGVIMCNLIEDCDQLSVLGWILAAEEGLPFARFIFSPFIPR